ncbi:Helicase associated domain protein [Actinomadura sp. LOL_016]|uniref:Helicase associated domain protein n=1 Tax=unclassified Actinomadura TaxID=2626254 RepID=UPI003A80F5D9
MTALFDEAGTAAQVWTAGPVPRPHQQKVLDALAAARAAGGTRLQARMACGTGKTFVGRWHAAAAAAGTTLVLCPSLALVAQTLREWRRASGPAFEALVLCSDPSTSAGAAEQGGHDGADGQVSSPEWTRARARVTTSAMVAAEFLQARRPNRPQVVFGTYHSAPVARDAAALADTGFDLVVCDEAHHLAGRPRAEFTAALDVRARSRLFMTATPVILTDAAGTADGAASMDDPEVFGRVAHTLKFGDAIGAGLLADYRVLVHGAAADRGGAALPAMLVDAIDRHGVRTLLTYHGRNVHAAALAKALDGAVTPGGWTVHARHISGTTPAGERAAALAWLGEPSDEVRVITNVNCLVEGVDVPAVDGIAICGQRTSTVDIVQAVGRVLRAAPGKRHGWVILPIEIPDGDDTDAALLASQFGHVWKVLRALRAHDQRLGDEIDTAATAWTTYTAPAVDEYDEYAGITRQRHPERPTGRVVFELPDWVDMGAVYARMLTETRTHSAHLYGLLQAYAQDPARRMPPPITMKWGGESLGRWCEQQIRAYRKGLLDPEQTAAMEAVPGWLWDRDLARWRDTYLLVKGVADERGTLTQPLDADSIYAGLRDRGQGRGPLGEWAATQRQLHRDDMLPAERARMLESLPGWRWDAGLPADDVAMVQALRMFGEFNGHADIPEAHVEDGAPLGRWVWAVRRRRLVGRLHPTLAEEIGAASPREDKGESTFEWRHNETRWRLGYSALRHYQARTGTASPPNEHSEALPDTAVGLGRWAAQQRHKYRIGELDAAYARWLEAVPGWTWEVPLGSREYGDPIDLGGHPHGTAKGIAAKCPCRPCVDADRANGRRHLARRRQVKNGVPAGRARRRVQSLTGKGHTLAAIHSVCGVPIGVLRGVSTGHLDEIERRHDTAIMAVTAAMCATVPTRVRSRGRAALASNAKVDAAPTHALLDDLAARGFGPAWVARELGYQRRVQIGRDRVLRRTAEAVAGLHTRVGDLVAPPSTTRRMPPPLAELLVAEGGAA